MEHKALIPDIPPDDGTDETHHARSRAIVAWWRNAIFDQIHRGGKVGRKRWRITWDLYKALAFDRPSCVVFGFSPSSRGDGDLLLGIPVEICDGPVYFFELVED